MTAVTVSFHVVTLPRWLPAILTSPEVLWLLSYAVARLVGSLNTDPEYRLNSLLMTLSWLAPILIIAATYLFAIQLQYPGSPWWLLTRLTLCSLIGSIVVSSAFLSAYGGPGASGTPALFLLTWPLHWLIILGFSGYVFVRLIGSGQGGRFLTFAGQGVAVVLVLCSLVWALQRSADRDIERGSGESKARQLAKAYALKMGAKYPDMWRDGGTRLGRFTVSFQEPNSIRLRVETDYDQYAGYRGDRAAIPTPVRTPSRTVAAWNGLLGRLLLAEIKARRQWVAVWDGSEGNLGWETVIDMTGLTRKQFLEDGDEAVRVSLGGLGEEAPAPTWWLLGGAAEAALQERDGTRQALRWLQVTLKNEANYFGNMRVRRGREEGPAWEKWQEMKRDFLKLSETARTLADAEAPALEDVRQLEREAAALANAPVPYLSSAEMPWLCRGALYDLRFALSVSQALQRQALLG